MHSVFGLSREKSSDEIPLCYDSQGVRATFPKQVSMLCCEAFVRPVLAQVFFFYDIRSIFLRESFGEMPSGQLFQRKGNWAS